MEGGKFTLVKVAASAGKTNRMTVKNADNFNKNFIAIPLGSTFIDDLTIHTNEKQWLTIDAPSDICTET